MSARLLSLVKLLLLGAFIAGAVWFFRFTDTGREITPAALLEYVRGFDPLASRLVYVGVYIVGTMMLIPGTILSFVGALLFGVLEGTLYTLIGATIGATGAFFIAKALGRDFVDRLVGGRLQALDQRLREHGFTGLLILRLVPLFPFNGINFGCGLTAIRTRDYILATAIGIVPGVFVYQYLFATIGPRLLEEGMRWEYLWDVNLLLALSLFVAFCVVGRRLTAKLKTAAEAAPRLPTTQSAVVPPPSKGAPPAGY